MTPAETLLAEAREAGVHLFLYRGELSFESEPGALTPSLLVRLRAAKQELHALLSAAAADETLPEAEDPEPTPPPVKRPAPAKPAPPPPETCPRCHKKTRWLPLTWPGRFLCGACWFGVGSDYPPGGPPPDPQPTTPCYCTSTSFWRSPTGVVHCAACSPPARPTQATWLEVETKEAAR